MKPGDQYQLDLPGHERHKRSVTIVSQAPAFNLAPDDAIPVLSGVVFVKWPGQEEPIGVGWRHLKPMGT